MKVGLFKKKEVIDQTKKVIQEPPMPPPPQVVENPPPEPQPVQEEEQPKTQVVKVLPYEIELQVLIEGLQRVSEELEEIKILLRQAVRNG